MTKFRGSIEVTADEARRLSHGGIERVLLERLIWNPKRKENAKAEPEPGDLFWIAEPFVLYHDGKSGYAEIAFGSMADHEKPEWFRNAGYLRKLKIKPSPAARMWPGQARMALEFIPLAGEGAATLGYFRVRMLSVAPC